MSGWRTVGAAGMAAACMAMSGGAALGQDAITTREVVWAKPDGLELMAKIYEPARAPGTASPALVDVHGGVWTVGDRNSDEVYDSGLARAGILVVAIDMRQGPDYQHPVASRDVAAAVRWVKLNASALGVDPDHVGVGGSSSGGHLALYEAILPNAEEHKGTPIRDASGAVGLHDDIDASVDFVVALWPVADPLARFRYAQKAGMEPLVQMQGAYFPDEAMMLDASVPRVIIAGDFQALPPALVVQPGRDGNVPAEITLDLVRAYQAREGKIELAYYPGMPHGFGGRPSPETDDMIAVIADFVHRRTGE